MDNDLVRLWGLVAELSDQINNNRAVTAALQAQAGVLKGQAIHTGTGFALRRFNTDISKEVFESELERMNAAIIIENQSLQHENKQLNSLLKEYEQTLETVMSKFRNQAHAAQQHELTLTRHYEGLLLARETNELNQELQSSTQISMSATRLSQLLRRTLRSVGGEVTSDEPQTPESTLEEAGAGGYTGTSEGEDWALERESEISRLEKENEELRKLLGIAEALDKEDIKEWPRLELPPPRAPMGASRRGSGFGRTNYMGFGVFPVRGNLATRDRDGPTGPEAILGHQ